jgi:hypothetical protein
VQLALAAALVVPRGVLAWAERVPVADAWPALPLLAMQGQALRPSTARRRGFR